MGTVTMAHFGVPRRAGSGEPEVPVNWRRGLFRVWVLLSAAWVMGWTIHLAMHGLQGGFKTTGDFLVIPVLLFGLAAGWAIRGFKADNSPSGK